MRRNQDTRISQRYHRISKQSRSRTPAKSYGVDWDADWRQTKSYRLAERVLLNPPGENFIGSSALSLLSSTVEGEDGAERLCDDGLASLLYLGYGVTGSRSHGSAIYRLRAAPSAGAVYPTEVYLIAGDFGVLPAGVYHFSPEDCSLELLREGDWRGEVASICPEGEKGVGKFYLAFTSMCRRAEKRFGTPAYRYCLLDGGHVIGNFLALLDGLGCPAGLKGSFDDGRLYDLLGVRREEEAILAVLQIGGEECAAGCPILSEEEETGGGGEAIQVPERNGRERSTALRIHGAGSSKPGKGRAGGGPRAAPRNDVSPSRASARSLCITEHLLTRLDKADIGEVLGSRRTTRRFTKGGLTKAELAVLTASCAVPYDADWLESPKNKDGIDFFEQVELFVAVRNMRSLEGGIYRCDGTGGGLARMDGGGTGEEMVEICMGQSAAAEASAVFFIAPRLSGYLERFGNRGYRYAGMHAGIIGERIYLASTALGLGVSGIAGLDDDLANRLCGVDGAETAVMYALAVGRPVKKGKD